ncbi:MAG: hypothetical protein V9E82_02970 [Candidatus Nanopelagicales bacterium]
MENGLINVNEIHDPIRASMMTGSKPNVAANVRPTGPGIHRGGSVGGDVGQPALSISATATITAIRLPEEIVVIVSAIDVGQSAVDDDRTEPHKTREDEQDVQVQGAGGGARRQNAGEDHERGTGENAATSTGARPKLAAMMTPSRMTSAQPVFLGLRSFAAGALPQADV